MKAGCNHPIKNFSCGGCNKFAYCSESCANKHWVKYNHYLECIGMNNNNDDEEDEYEDFANQLGNRINSGREITMANANRYNYRFLLRYANANPDEGVTVHWNLDNVNRQLIPREILEWIGMEDLIEE